MGDDAETVTVKLNEEEAKRLQEGTNIPQAVIETIYERHKDLLEDGVQRDAIVSKREVPMKNGHVAVWGDWE